MTKVRHVLGISGGKDSAALAIYMKQKYPTLEVEYYNSDTGCELEETEKLVNNLESFLGKIERLKPQKVVQNQLHLTISSRLVVAICHRHKLAGVPTK